MKHLIYAGIGLTLIAIVYVSLFAAVTGIVAFIFQWLWNWVIVDVFDMSMITFKQSFGIVLIIMLISAALGSVKVNQK